MENKQLSPFSHIQKVPLYVWLFLAIGLIFFLWRVPQQQTKPIQEQIDKLKDIAHPLTVLPNTSPLPKTSSTLSPKLPASLKVSPIPSPNVSPRSFSVDPKDIINLEKAKLDAEISARNSLFQGIGGLFFIASAIIAYKNLEATRRNVKAAEDKQVAERFSKAVEMLGNQGSIHIRLGGIYSLEHIAKFESNYYWTVMEVLTAFVRQESPSKAVSDNDDSKESSRYFIKDIQAALTVIGKQNFNQDAKDKILDLGSTNLEGCELPNAYLRQAILIRTNFSNATLNEAHLEGAILNEAVLEGTRLKNAHLNKAHLDNACLVNAILIEADLRGAYLIDARLEGADFTGAKLQGTDFTGAKLQGAVLAQANLEGANLQNKDLQNVNLQGAILKKADLTGANLAGADLTGADLTGANLTGTNFQRADWLEAFQESEDMSLTAAKLEGVDLTEATIVRTNFIFVNLRNATFTKAELNYPDFNGADLTGVNIAGVDFTRTYGLTYLSLTDAKIDNATQLPNNIQRPQA
ncbi:MAG: pentapeptide repeat-containing protein [Scytolyngbya sp. HA4215-MV1]|jgi:uncharacterized protein YjbI with pentapeptide repeats|nr:pentapeptide repeat-containing protein [Scytolyngbya sp. HA4215-MV1]